MRRPTLLFVPLAAVLLIACGPGEVGEECQGGSADNDCVDGAFCTQEPSDTLEPPEDPNALRFFCREICDSGLACPEGTSCRRAEGSMVSVCQPDEPAPME